MRQRWVLLGVLALTAACASGCGTADRENDIRTVAERFAGAIERDDGAAACALLTSAARQQLETDAKKPCEEAVLELAVSPPPVGRVEVWITAGSADLLRGGTLFLDDTPAGWRVGAAGCMPQTGRLPYECELEG